jgi:uncharacterized damage-inducible protein DinB
MTATRPAGAVPGSLSVAALLYPDFDTEFATTRRFLERYPAGKDDWRPHQSSRPLRALANHVADLTGRGTLILETDGQDIAARQPKPEVGTGAELVAVLDANVARFRTVLEGVDFAALERPWTLRMGPKIIVQLPKRLLLRTMLMSHLVHHRAQLGVYYRLLGIPVPGAYGPSADEGLAL